MVMRKLGGRRTKDDAQFDAADRYRIRLVYAAALPQRLLFG